MTCIGVTLRTHPPGVVTMRDPPHITVRHITLCIDLALSCCMIDTTR
jgi:hypothetical protein